VRKGGGRWWQNSLQLLSLELSSALPCPGLPSNWRTESLGWCKGWCIEDASTLSNPLARWATQSQSLQALGQHTHQKTCPGTALGSRGARVALVAARTALGSRGARAATSAKGGRQLCVATAVSPMAIKQQSYEPAQITSGRGQKNHRSAVLHQNKAISPNRFQHPESQKHCRTATTLSPCWPLFGSAGPPPCCVCTPVCMGLPHA
jgi:hypothetical protein